MRRPDRLKTFIATLALVSSILITPNTYAKCAPEFTVGLRPMVMAFASTKSNSWVKKDKCLKNLWTYVSKNNLKSDLYFTALTTLHNALQTGAHNYETSKCSMELLMMLEENEVEENSLLEKVEDDLRRCISPTKKESEERALEMSDDFDAPLE